MKSSIPGTALAIIAVAAAQGFVSVSLGNDLTATVKRVPLDNQPYVLADHPPRVGKVERATLLSFVEGARCRAFSDERAESPVGSVIRQDEDTHFEAAIKSLRCDPSLVLDGSFPVTGWTETRRGKRRQAAAPKVAVTFANSDTAVTKYIPLDNTPFVLADNPPRVGAVEMAIMINDAGVKRARCRAFADSAATQVIGKIFSHEDTQIGQRIAALRCSSADVSDRSSPAKRHS